MGSAETKKWYLTASSAQDCGAFVGLINKLKGDIQKKEVRRMCVCVGVCVWLVLCVCVCDVCLCLYVYFFVLCPNCARGSE